MAVELARDGDCAGPDGPCGCGKTTLVAALARKLASRSAATASFARCGRTRASRACGGRPGAGGADEGHPRRRLAASAPIEFFHLVGRVIHTEPLPNDATGVCERRQAAGAVAQAFADHENALPLGKEQHAHEALRRLWRRRPPRVRRGPPLPVQHRRVEGRGAVCGVQRLLPDGRHEPRRPGLGTERPRAPDKRRRAHHEPPNQAGDRLGTEKSRPLAFGTRTSPSRPARSWRR